jgi:chromosome segregation ATPase
MSLKAARDFAGETLTHPGDDFPALEEKIYKTIELLKSARAGQSAAERDANRVREQLEQREEELEMLRSEVVSLRKEREEVRSRVEKMLKQIDALVAENPGA